MATCNYDITGDGVCAKAPEKEKRYFMKNCIS